MGRIDNSPSQLIDAKIAELGDWRGETLARVREIVKQEDPAGLFKVRAAVALNESRAG